MLGRGDENCVDRRIVEQMAIVAIGLGARSEFRGIGETARPDVRERREFDAGACGRFARKLRAAITNADDTDSKTIIRAEDPACREAAGKAGRDVADEVSSCLHGTSSDFTACHKLRLGGV